MEVSYARIDNLMLARPRRNFGLVTLLFLAALVFVMSGARTVTEGKCHGCNRIFPKGKVALRLHQNACLDWKKYLSGTMISKTERVKASKRRRLENFAQSTPAPEETDADELDLMVSGYSSACLREN